MSRLHYNSPGRQWTFEDWLLAQKTKIALAIFAVLFASMVLSCQELKYMVKGKTADATLSTRKETIRDEDGTPHTHLVVGYRYQDGPNLRENYVSKPLDWPRASESTIKVQYIPGRDQSRFLGETNRIWLFIFFGSIAAAVAGAIWLAREK